MHVYNTLACKLLSVIWIGQLFAPTRHWCEISTYSAKAIANCLWYEKCENCEKKWETVTNLKFDWANFQYEQRNTRNFGKIMNNISFLLRFLIENYQNMDEIQWFQIFYPWKLTYIHNSTSISPVLWCMMGETWADFSKIVPETSPSCMKLVTFDVFFQIFRKEIQNVA